MRCSVNIPPLMVLQGEARVRELRLCARGMRRPVERDLCGPALVQDVSIRTPPHTHPWGLSSTVESVPQRQINLRALRAESQLRS